MRTRVRGRNDRSPGGLPALAELIGRDVMTYYRPSSTALLSAREREVMKLVANGDTNSSIAHTMGISPRTVAKHLERIYRKLHVSNRAAAVARLV